MALFGISVLVRLAGIDGLSFQAIVSQQGAVALLEEIAVAEVVHRGGESIGTVHLGNPSQFPEGVLETLAEALETLGETDRPRLPVGVGQNEVIDHVIERLTGQRDPQVVHVSEVGGAEFAGRVDLIEEHLLGRTRDGLPRLDLPLQGAELAVGKPAREPPLEILEEGLGLEPGIELQQIARVRAKRPGTDPPGSARILGSTIHWASDRPVDTFERSWCPYPPSKPHDRAAFLRPSSWRSLRTWRSVFMAVAS